MFLPSTNVVPANGAFPKVLAALPSGVAIGAKRVPRLEVAAGISARAGGVFCISREHADTKHDDAVVVRALEFTDQVSGYGIDENVGAYANIFSESRAHIVDVVIIAAGFAGAAQFKRRVQPDRNESHADHELGAVSALVMGSNARPQVRSEQLSHSG